MKTAFTRILLIPGRPPRHSPGPLGSSEIARALPLSSARRKTFLANAVNFGMADLDPPHSFENQALAKVFFVPRLGLDGRVRDFFGSRGTGQEKRPRPHSSPIQGDCDMMWLVTVQGIEIPVRAASREKLIERLEDYLGPLFKRVSISTAPLPDREELRSCNPIRFDRNRLVQSLN